MRKKIVFIMTFFMLVSLTPIYTFAQDEEDVEFGPDYYNKTFEKMEEEIQEMIENGHEAHFLLKFSNDEGDAAVLNTWVDGNKNPVKFYVRYEIYSGIHGFTQSFYEPKISDENLEVEDGVVFERSIIPASEALDYYFLYNDQYYYMNEDYEKSEISEKDEQHKLFFSYLKTKELGSDYFRKFDGDKLHPMYDDHAYLENGVVKFKNDLDPNTNDSSYYKYLLPEEEWLEIPFNEKIKAYRIQSDDLNQDDLVMVSVNVFDYFYRDGHDVARIRLKNSKPFSKPKKVIKVTAYDYAGNVLDEYQVKKNAGLAGPYYLHSYSSDNIFNFTIYSNFNEFKGSFAAVFPDQTIKHGELKNDLVEFTYEDKERTLDENAYIKIITRSQFSGVQITSHYSLDNYRILDENTFSSLLEDIRRVNFSRYTSESKKDLIDALVKYGCQEELEFIGSSEKASSSTDIDYYRGSLELMWALASLEANDTYVVDIFEKISFDKYDKVTQEDTNLDEVSKDQEKDKEESKDQESVVNTKPVPEKVDENKLDSAKDEGKDILPETGIGSNTLLHASGLVVLGFILRKKSKQ